MTENRARAEHPEDIARLFVERVNAADLDGILELFEPEAVVAYPIDRPSTGTAALRELYGQLLAARPTFEVEEPLPTLISGDIALTSTRPKDGTGGRVQVVRRQPEGHWLRVLDRPEAG
ncbi:nuclear transport factor 2 family protein [Streptomyces sp. NPDC051976]|uniref:YybH family protein n=1 Tax=Streptomyces sp. NPDC051976 TaxID=3154947 RepID=UPI00342605EF